MTLLVADLNEQHLDAAAGLFARAFAADSGIQVICGTGDGYQRRAEAWFRATLQMVLAGEQLVWGILAEGEVVAAAIVTYSSYNPSAGDLLRWSWQVGRQSGGLGMLWRTMEHVWRLEGHHPVDLHCVLEFLAVDARYRGRGYARLLLERLHQFSMDDEQSYGVWLETANPANEALYAHFAYRVVGRVQLKRYETIVMFREDVSADDTIKS